MGSCSSQGIAIIRQVQVKMKLKVSHDKLTVEVLDNEPIKKTYDGAIKHFSRIRVERDEKYMKTVQTENLPSLR
jgi:non-canonical (house-cleaning) NTP pyrophosphatase